MITINEINKEKLEEIRRFYNFYDDNLVKSCSGFLTPTYQEISTTDYYRAYLNIVKRTAEFIKYFTNSNDPILACIVFQYLLWNGYLSKDKKLVYSISDRINNPVVTGADIMLGKSVCLNNADMQTSVLRAMGHEAYLLGCEVDPHQEANFEYRPNIDREINPKVKISDRVISKLVQLTPLKRIGNHAVTLFKEESMYMISDPTALAFAQYIDFLKAQYVGSDLTLNIKMGLSLLSGQMTPQNFTTIVNQTFLQSDHHPLTNKHLKVIYDTVVNMCHLNSPIFNDFHKSNIEDIDIVCQKLTKKPHSENH